MSREFRRLADEHGGRIYAFALHMLRSREDAEDVTQEALVRLWNHRDAVDPARVGAWVMRVTRNLAIDASRRRRMRSAMFAEGPAATEAAEAIAATPSIDTAERRELRDAIESAVDALDEPYRSILIMRDVQDLTYTTIAESMAMPLGTVKVYLHRARRRVRDRVNGRKLHAE